MSNINAFNSCWNSKRLQSGGERTAHIIFPFPDPLQLGGLGGELNVCRVRRGGSVQSGCTRDWLHVEHLRPGYLGDDGGTYGARSLGDDGGTYGARSL